MDRADMKEPLCLKDSVGELAENIRKNWLIGLRQSNPAILDMFHERDRKPYRDLLPWSGEFAGKYITGAYYMYQLGRDPSLYQYMLDFLEELLTCIDEDGYKSVYTILDGVKGKGHYVGTYMAWGVNNNGWWGEGEIKFYMDGDTEYPTVCGTGTEDYFCGSYDFEDPYTHDKYLAFTTPYTGFHEVRRDELYNCQKRFGMYRWHIVDPIRFESDLKVTIQALGWREGGRYLPLQDDIASVAFWYQEGPAAPFPELPDKDYMEVI